MWDVRILSKSSNSARVMAFYGSKSCEEVAEIYIKSDVKRNSLARVVSIIFFSGDGKGGVSEL